MGTWTQAAAIMESPKVDAGREQSVHWRQRVYCQLETQNRWPGAAIGKTVQVNELSLGCSSCKDKRLAV